MQKIYHLVPLVLTGLANFFGGPTQIDQLVPLVLTGLAKNLGGPTQIYHLELVWTKILGDPPPFPKKKITKK